MHDIDPVLIKLRALVSQKLPAGGLKKGECIDYSKLNTERHQRGFDGEHIASDTLHKMGYKVVESTRHKDAIDIVTSNTCWEVKAISKEAKHHQMSVKPEQKARKLAFAKKEKKKVKSMMVILNDTAEIYVKDGIGKWRKGGMQKVRTISNWRTEVGHGRTERFTQTKEKVKRKPAKPKKKE